MTRHYSSKADNKKEAVEAQNQTNDQINMVED